MRSLLFFLACTGFCLLGGTSRGETLDELKGLSIWVRWTYTWLNRIPPESRWVKLTGQRQALRVYISTLGNIFSEQDATNDADHTARAFNKVTLGKAASRKDGVLLYTWAFVDGHLTQILQETKGIRVYTLEIQPAALTCRFFARDEPDKVTGEFIVPSPNGPWQLEIQHREVETSSCVVQRGNIFIPGQE
jgi:hypothetical protein